MTSHTKDDKQSDQSVKQSKDKHDTEKKPFDPVEYHSKKLEGLGIVIKKVEPPKNRCWIFLKR
jgi:hypothetical protein